MSILLDAVNRQQQEQTTPTRQAPWPAHSGQFRLKRLGMLLFVLGMASGSAVTALYFVADATSRAAESQVPTPNVSVQAQQTDLQPQKVALPLPEAQPWDADIQADDDWATDSAQPAPVQKVERAQQTVVKAKPKVEIATIEPEIDLEDPIEPMPSIKDAPDTSQLKVMQQAWLEEKVLNAAQEVFDAEQEPESETAAKAEPTLNLAVSVHQYSPNAQNRFLVIDTHFVNEGDVLANGAKLLQIRANDAIFEYQGEKIILNLVDD